MNWNHTATDLKLSMFDLKFKNHWWPIGAFLFLFFFFFFVQYIKGYKLVLFRRDFHTIEGSQIKNCNFYLETTTLDLWILIAVDSNQDRPTT